MNEQPSLTDAQYRFLGRAVRHEHLPVSRFRPEHPTIRALVSKRLLALDSVEGTEWGATHHGRDVHARHGKQPISDDMN